jgi:hypothetical protein
MFNSIFTLLLILFPVFYFFNDFKNTKGFRKQKIIHVVLIAFLLYDNQSSFDYLISLFSDFNNYYEIHYKSVGIIPPFINLTINIVSIILRISVVLCSWGLMTRSEKSRKLLVKLIPFLALIIFINIYVGTLKYNVDLERNIFTMVALVIPLFYFLIMWMYQGKSMIVFFKNKTENTEIVTDNNKTIDNV